MKVTYLFWRKQNTQTMKIKVNEKEAEYIGMEIEDSLPKIDIFLTYIGRYNKESVQNYINSRNQPLVSIELVKEING